MKPGTREEIIKVQPVQKIDVELHLLRASEGFPSNPALPLPAYRQALCGTEEQVAEDGARLLASAVPRTESAAGANRPRRAGSRRA